MMLLAIRGDERKDLVQKSLSRSSFKLCLTLLSLLEFINQNIHYERLFHIMRLRANAVDALDEGDELSLLVMDIKSSSVRRPVVHFLSVSKVVIS